tara:strand:+ start:937 stop:1779 length:843 start_codon:yes stop_codon:yes gene_type:complete
MNILSAIDQANKLLITKGIISSRLDCEILMSKVTQTSRGDVLLNLNKELTIKELEQYKNLIEQRSKKKPIAYIIEKKEFWKDDFYVTKDVLIPRPDTELIVQNVLEITKKRSSLNILDIGVGSGCIILSILKERTTFKGTGIDISKKSLNICRINSDNLRIFNRLKLFKSDIDNFNYGKYDLIISNPPYIKKFDLKYLDKDVVGFEPKLALDGGLDGLSGIRKVINNSTRLIKRKGILILEIGFDQADKVKEILKKNGFYLKNVLKDLANKNRCMISIKI